MTQPILHPTILGKCLLIAAWLPLGLCARAAFAQDETPGAAAADPAVAAEGTILPAGAAGTESPTAAPADAGSAADASAGASVNGAVESKAAEPTRLPQTYEYIETIELKNARGAFRYRMRANCLVQVTITEDRNSGEEKLQVLVLPGADRDVSALKSLFSVTWADVADAGSTDLQEGAVPEKLRQALERFGISLGKGAAIMPDTGTGQSGKWLLVDQDLIYPITKVVAKDGETDVNTGVKTDKVTVNVYWPKDPPPGKLVLERKRAAADATAPWARVGKPVALAAAQSIFTFAPEPGKQVGVEGLGPLLNAELQTVLRQGPVTTIVEPDSTSFYAIQLRSNGKVVKLLGEQHNEKMPVNWTLSELGPAAQDQQGWKMPIRLELPRQSTGKKNGMEITTRAELNYATFHQGPDQETRVVTELSFPSGNEKEKEKTTYRRTSVLRPYKPLDESSQAEAPTHAKNLEAAVKDRAATWTRTATLATLGVQRLRGLRETGLAIWLAQAQVDAAAASDKLTRDSFKSLAKITPMIEPPIELDDEANHPANGRYRLEATTTLVPFTLATDSGGSVVEDTATSLVPSTLIGYDFYLGRRWRAGVEFEAQWINFDTSVPDAFWSNVLIGGRISRRGKRYHWGLTGGAQLVQYAVEVEGADTLKIDGALPFGGAFDLYTRISSKQTLGLRLMMVLPGDGLEFRRIQVCWQWFIKPNMGLQAQFVSITLSDQEAGVDGKAKWTAEGGGVGLGLAVRW